MKKSVMLIIGLILPVQLMAFSGGPPDEKTGAPGEGTCIDCHSSFPINSGDGELVINAPATFHAGETYQITVELSDPGQSRWGFEFTPLNQGSVTITDPANTQLSNSGNNAYVKQTSAGTFNGTPNGPVNWTFDWTAPADPPSQVTFYAAANAANANGNTSGDYIYATSVTLDIATAIDEQVSVLPASFALKSYPNPFNARVNIAYSIPENESVDISIYDIRGNLVTRLVEADKSAGSHVVTWDGRNSFDNEVASGIYFVRLSAVTGEAVNRLVLVR
jgi:hypothetical protein